MFLFGFIVCLSYGLLHASAATQTASRLFVPGAWPKETGSPVNSSPVLGDLDGDNILEIVVGADNGKVYAWKPDGILMPGWPVTTGDSVRSSPALADIDGDGRLDVIVGSFDNKVYAWNFNGSLLPGWPVVTGSVVYSSPAVGDIDGDQRPEVVVGSFDNKVYAWNADGTLVRGWPKSTGLFVYSSPALADIDKDGLVEVIVGTDNNRVFAWNGDGTDVEGWPTATEHVVPSSPAVGDIDNDQELEVVVGSWDQVFVWNSQGERKPGWPVTAGHQIASSPALADVNRDGLLEIIIGCKDGRVYVWDTKGRPMPGWPAVTDAEISASPAVADLDGDGKLEVIIGSKDNKIYIWDAEGRLFPGWPKNTADAVSSSPAVGDVDHDGTLELVIGSKDGKVYAWNFPRSGNFAPKVVWQNFHGDPAHTGVYGSDVDRTKFAIASPGKPQQIVPVQPVLQEQPPKQVTVAQQPATSRQLNQDVIIPEEIIDGYVKDLLITDYNENNVTLTWTSPPGLWTSKAVYEIHYAPQEITEETWQSATPYKGVIHPAPAGTREVYKLTNLTPAGQRPPERLYIALKVKEGQKDFPLSNVARLERLDTTPPAKIQGLKVIDLDEQQVELSWQTTGDDGMNGTATTYDIRYAEVPLNDSTWLRAGQVENEPAPLPAGTVQKFQIPRTWGDKQVFFGIKAIDEALNISDISDIAVWVPGDKMPPAQIADLRVTGVTKDGIAIAWTAPGDNQNIGKAERYDIRYASIPMTEEDWDQAVSVKNPPLPENAGTAQTYTLQDVPLNVVKFIGMKTIDANKNVSALSNVVEIVDVMPPDAVTDLSIEDIKPGEVTINWTAPKDNGEVARVSGYDLRYALDEITDENWEAAKKLTVPLKPSEPGKLETFAVKGMPQNSAYYLALKSADALGNVSVLSNVLKVPKYDKVAPAPIIDLFVEDTGTDWAKITWTATGNDNQEGQAASYQIRVAPNLQTLRQWERATSIPTDSGPTPLSPSEAGTKESFTITGLSSKSTIYIAVKAVDDFGNVSEISNIVRAKTKDDVPPAAISDLRVANITEDQVVLEWTATGDDGTEGQAQAYDLRSAQERITQDNWQSAQVVPLVPRPASAGKTETAAVPSLESGAMYYFALVATDSSGNVSPLSNVVDALTKDTVPPSAITTLRADKVDENSVVLTWLSPGNDKYRSAPERYEIRYRKGKELLSESSWSQGTEVAEPPVPSAKGEQERFTLSGLQKNAYYSIGIKALDEYHNVSEISNVILVYTSSDSVKDLGILDFSGQSVTLTWTAPGGEISGDKRMYEIRYATTPLTDDTWSNAALAKTASPQALNVKDPASTEKIAINELPPNEQLFFAVRVIQVGAENRLSGLSNVAELNRIDILPPGEITNLQVKDTGAVSNGMRSLQLTWTAPGDNDLEGTATKYDIRYGNVPPTAENWDTLTPVKTPPKPLNAGTEQQTTVQIRPGEDDVYFAIKTYDEALNVSDLSNMAKWSPEDHTPPAAITDLKVERVNGGDITLSWTAPGDNADRGIAVFYDIRYAIKEGDVKKWDNAMVVSGEPLPEAAGKRQEYTLTGLQPDTMYYLAMTTTDDARNTSALSNIVTVRTADAIPPAPITDLSVDKTGTDWVKLFWTASGDDDNSGRAAAYSLRYAPELETLQNWDNAYEVMNVSKPGEPGKQEDFTVKGLKSNTRYYFGIKAIDNSGNKGELSNVVQTLTVDGESSEPINDLVLVSGTDTTVKLSWKAPQDRGPIPRMAQYDIRFSEDRKRLEEWNQATKVKYGLVPGESGTSESVVIEKLAPNKRYYVALKAIDSKGNISEISNIVPAYTTDTVPPEPVTDLSAQAANEHAIALSWTVVLDDPVHDTPETYAIRYSLEPIDETNWEKAEVVEPADVNALRPSAPGVQMNYTVTGLAENTNYYFAMRAIDVGGNISPLSNVIAARTNDSIPPQAVTDLQAIFPTANSVLLTWTSPSDTPTGPTKEVLPIGSYDIRYATTPPGKDGYLDAQTWENAEKVLAPVKANLPGVIEECVVRNLEPGKTYYFAMKAIDPSGNAATISNTTVETTLPAEIEARASRAMTEKLAWEIVQGQDKGELQKDDSGVFRVAQKGGTQGTQISPMTIGYPQSGKVLSVQQGDLVFQVQSSQRVTLYVKVQAATGDLYYLCYSTDFAATEKQSAPDTTQPASSIAQPVSTQRQAIRMENQIFLPIDPTVLDGAWHDVRLNLAQDLMDGTGLFYDQTLRLTVRGQDLAFKNMVMQGAVATKIADFEDQRDPLENGWKIHFGTGAVQVVKEPVLSTSERPMVRKLEVVPRTVQENSFLSVKADTNRGIVVTYPQEGTGQLSNKPFFLANVKAIGDFKIILKVMTKDNREYSLVYLPNGESQQSGVSGTYIYLPLHVESSEGEDWSLMQANIAQDLQALQLEYAYTSWISFHGKEFSLDNVRFSTDILETPIE